MWLSKINVYNLGSPMVVKTSMGPLDLLSMSQLISWGFLLAYAWSLWLFVVQ